jgi:two-component system sensor histidine kinase KdpD
MQGQGAPSIGEVSAKAGGSVAGDCALPPTRGRLLVFLGAAPGAGKTFAMLAEGRRLADEGVAVVVGLAETHGRADTERMLNAMERIAPRMVDYRGKKFDELDVDALLNRHPAVTLVDELAHRCVPGSRHEKRWEDVEELLDAGIDVVTSLNVQHLQSLNDEVEELTGTAQQESVPDSVVAAADQIEFVDITPEQLRSRIARTDVMDTDATQMALEGFFSAEHLATLRSLALGWLDGHHRLDPGLRTTLENAGLPSDEHERVVVALTGSPEAEHVLRRASRIASSTRGELIGVYVRVPSDSVEAEPPWLAGQRRLLSELGGRYAELAGIDVASIVLEFARTEGARQLVLGATRRTRREELLHGSVINKAIRAAGPIEVHVIPALERSKAAHPVMDDSTSRPPRALLPGPRRATAWVLAVVLPIAVTFGLIPVRSSLELSGVLLCNLLAVVGVALLGGIRPAGLATGVAFLASDFFYAPPFYTLRVGRAVDLIALITFVVVAAAVGGLVDLLTRQSVRVAQAYAEAEDLARLAADNLVGSEQLVETLRSLWRTFDLDGMTVLRRDGDRWTVEATVGSVGFEKPEAAPFSVEIATGRVIALAGRRLNDKEATLLRTFLDQLRFARERAVLRTLEDEK